MFTRPLPPTATTVPCPALPMLRPAVSATQTFFAIAAGVILLHEPLSVSLVAGAVIRIAGVAHGQGHPPRGANAQLLHRARIRGDARRALDSNKNLDYGLFTGMLGTTRTSFVPRATHSTFAGVVIDTASNRAPKSHLDRVWSTRRAALAT